MSRTLVIVGQSLVARELFSVRAIVLPVVPRCAHGALLHTGKPGFEYTALQLSTDHTCKEEAEAALVRQRSKDPNPIRLAAADVVCSFGYATTVCCHGSPRIFCGGLQRSGVNGVRRVAGSLVVTRALGDAYLKKAELSLAPYQVQRPLLYRPSCEIVQ